MFKKRKWSKWEHIGFVQDFRAGISTFELLRREDEITGLVEWKRIYVKDCVHNLVLLLSDLWGKNSDAFITIN